MREPKHNPFMCNCPDCERYRFEEIPAEIRKGQDGLDQNPKEKKEEKK